MNISRYRLCLKFLLCGIVMSLSSWANAESFLAKFKDDDGWLVGGGHFAHWRDDTIRYEGVAGYASMNLKFYGVPGSTGYADGIDFKSEGFFTEHPINFRWKDSNVFFGASWDYYNIATDIDLGLGIPEIEPLELDVQLSGLTATLIYDSFDNYYGDFVRARSRFFCQYYGYNIIEH